MWKRLHSRWFGAMAAALVVQQLIVASSVLFLAWAAKGIAGGGPWFGWFILYLVSLLLPYGFGMLAVHWRIRWLLDAISNFLAAGEAAYADRPALATDRAQRDKAATVYGKTAQDVLQRITEFIYNFLMLAMNAGFSAVAVAAVLDLSVGVAFAVGIALSMALSRLYGKRLERASQASEAARVEVTGTLSRFWDNVVLGNGYSRARWIDARDAQWSAYGVRLRRAVAAMLWLTTGQSLAAILPPVLTLGALAWIHRGDAAFLAVLLVTAPRVVVLLNSVSNLLGQVAGWSFVKGQVKVVDELFDLPAEPDLKARVDLARLRVEGAPIPDDPEALADWAASLPAAGRITLRGANGSGKSSLLLLLKASAGRPMFYLPAQHDLAFLAGPGSTGQRMLAILDEIEREVADEVILLDEWDANLDPENARAVSARIDALARRKLVIEIRHRAEGAAEAPSVGMLSWPPVADKIDISLQEDRPRMI